MMRQGMEMEVGCAWFSFSSIHHDPVIYLLGGYN